MRHFEVVDEDDEDGEDFAPQIIDVDEDDESQASHIIGTTLQPLVVVLRDGNAGSKLMLTALKALDCVMTVGEEHGLDSVEIVDNYDGINIILNLQRHPSKAVREAAIKFIERHFEVVDEDDETLAPQIVDVDEGDETLAPQNIDVDEGDENLPPQVNGATFGLGLASSK